MGGGDSHHTSVIPLAEIKIWMEKVYRVYIYINTEREREKVYSPVIPGNVHTWNSRGSVRAVGRTGRCFVHVQFQPTSSDPRTSNDLARTSLL